MPEDDLGFVADEDGDDGLGFEPDPPREPLHETGRRRLILPETTIAAGGPTTVAGDIVDEREVAPASDTMPVGFRETGRRMTVLPELTIGAGVNARGRITNRWGGMGPAGQGYEAREVVPDPGFRKPVRPEEAPAETRSTIERLAAWATGADPHAVDPELSTARGYLDAAARGLTDSALFGWQDEIRAGRRASGTTTQHSAFASPTFAGPAIAAALLGGDRYEAALDEERQADESARASHPWTYGAGQVGGAAPLAMVGGGATIPARMATAGGIGAATGALRGAGSSQADTLIDAYDRPSLARDALEGATLEGLLAAGGTGAAEGLVGPAVRRLAQWVARQGDDAAQAAVQSRLEATGVWGGRAMRAADEMPGGQEALADDLRRLGIGGELGRPGTTGPASRFPRPERALDDAAEVMSDAGERMRAVLDRMDEAASGASAGPRESRMQGMVDLTRVADEMEAIAREYDQLPVGGPQVAEALRRQIVEPLSAQGAVPFSDAHRQRMHLDRMIRSWSQDPNLATVAGRLQTARRAISRAMDDAAEALDPSLRDAWRQANRDYSVAAFLGDYGRGAERLSVQGGMGGAFGSAIENAGGGAVAPIIGAPIQREAAQQVRTRWPGIRAVALESLAPRLRALGGRGEQWARTLEAAQNRGGSALAAAHLMLTQTDPEYRRATEEMQGTEEE